jgi:predicted AAA+ superfamily ATPase
MSVRDGAISEQFVGQELIATIGRGKQELNYWLRDGKTTNAEIDYVVVTAGFIVPIEVKAGKSGTLRSLRTFCEQKRPKIAIRFDANLPSVQEIPFEKSTLNQHKNCLTYHLMSLPVYASCQVERLVQEYRGCT